MLILHKFTNRSGLGIYVHESRSNRESIHIVTVANWQAGYGSKI